MSSGETKKYNGTFTGAAAEITISKVPFQPRVIKFFATGGVWGIKVADEPGMDGANYLSSTAADSGVTISSTGFVVANGADVNVNGETVYFECED
jgi:hypothetical protein